MADGDLFQADLDLAFAFARSESGAWRDGDGAAQLAAPNAPRFDHDAVGTVRGLLVAGGVEPGGGDRLTLDPLILPAELLVAGLAGETGGTTADVTILHRFAAQVADDGDWAVERRAFYRRNVVAAIDALLGQAGHHLAIGVIPGFRLPTLAAALQRECTSIYFESPYRIISTLEILAGLAPEHQIVVARELTKRFEEFQRGTSQSVFQHFSAKPPKGEITLVIAPREMPKWASPKVPDPEP